MKNKTILSLAFLTCLLLVMLVIYKADVTYEGDSDGEPRASADPFEPNNDFDAAYPVWGAWYSTALDIEVGDWDFFKVWVTETQDIEVEIIFTHIADTGNLELYLYDPDLQQVAASTSLSDNESIDYTVLISGYYYLRVHEDGNDGYISYEMYLHVWGEPYYPTEPSIPGYSLLLVFISLLGAITAIYIRKKIIQLI